MKPLLFAHYNLEPFFVFVKMNGENIEKKKKNPKFFKVI